jgi:hypothetical protein
MGQLLSDAPFWFFLLGCLAIVMMVFVVPLVILIVITRAYSRK